MPVALLALGSNLGDRAARLRSAVEGLRELDPKLVVSSVYETDPVGGPPQSRYLNCVVLLETDLTPEELLDRAMALEQAAGRVRDVRNGPRTLDVDLLLVGDEKRETASLTLPHPRMNERAFVLAPLEEVAPHLVPKGWRERLGGKDKVDAQVEKVGTLQLS